MLSAEFVKNYTFGDLECAPGGQELLAVEIVAVLKAHLCTSLWMPFVVGPLSSFAEENGIRVERGPTVPLSTIDALYLGTPTIVNGKKLFPETAKGEWDSERERAAVRRFAIIANEIGINVLVTGLGSGDVSLSDRLHDMCIPGWFVPRVVCMKDFGEFVDHVIVTKRIKE